MYVYTINDFGSSSVTFPLPTPPPPSLCKRAACVKDNLELGFSQAQQHYFDTGNLIP